jgi:hypothetical protein
VRGEKKMAKEKAVALTDRTTTDILNSFLEKTLLNETAEWKAEKDLLLEGLERTIAYIPVSSEIEEKSKAITGFVREYFSMMIRDKYPQISNELLSLTRKVDVVGKRDYHEIKSSIDIPVFVYAAFGRQDHWEQTYAIKDEQYHAEVCLSSKAPLPTIAVREKAKEALAYCYDLESKALQVPVLGDLLIARREKADMPRPSKADLYVLWKPKPSELKVDIKRIIDRDPILTLAWENRIYLVTMWDAKEEEPFRHFLAEYCLK